MFLRPHPWFVRQIAVNAEHVFQITRETLGTDPDIVSEYTSIGDSLRDYIEARAQLNEMVRARKVRQELDDAAYQFCQAAKYKIDAEERAKYLVSRDEDPLDNEQINALIERAQQAAHEGFILAYAIQHAGYPSYMDFATAAKRVLDYSCKRLTEWFAQRRRNTQQQNQLSISATLSMINNMFVRGTR